MNFLKNIVALLIVGLIFLFASVFLINVFWNATPIAFIVSLMGGLGVCVLLYLVGNRLLHPEEWKRKSKSQFSNV